MYSVHFWTGSDLEVYQVPSGNGVWTWGQVYIDIWDETAFGSQGPHLASANQLCLLFMKYYFLPPSLLSFLPLSFSF